MTPQEPSTSRCVHRGPRFQVHARELQAVGSAPVTREVVVAPNAAVILPLIDPNNLVMIRNLRFAVDQTLWELPAGTIEKNEAPQRCAARELIEETGYRASELTPLTEFFPSPGICTERMHAFLARDLEHVGQQLDPTESITAEVVPLDRAYDWVQDHTIQDGKTIAVLLYYKNFVAV